MTRQVSTARLAANVNRLATNSTMAQRRNLITNPNFETNSAWIQGQQATVTNSSFTVSSSERSLFGTKSAKIVQGNGTAGHVYAVLNLNSTAKPGMRLTLSAYFLITSYTSGSLVLILNDSAFNRLATSSVSLSALTPKWIRLSCSYKVPATGLPNGTSNIVAIADGTGDCRYTAYMDGVLLEQGYDVSASPQTYFDGDSFGASWVGTANNSASILPQARISV